MLCTHGGAVVLSRLNVFSSLLVHPLLCIMHCSMYGKDDVAAGGMVAGIGVVSGVKCVIVANDATVSDTRFTQHTVISHLKLNYM
jgi:acetyl-CoA carboxylase carboxyltransferase component